MTPKFQFIEKSKWGPGAWQEEPDRMEWEHLGFPCLMTRTPMGSWCGYVAVPAGHPLFEVDYSKCALKPKCEESIKNGYCDHSPNSTVDVHGGLTYSDHCSNHICHVPKPGESDDVWWFGFDCAHSDDLVPSFKPMMEMLGRPDFMDGRQKYRDVPYVKKEVEALAQQLFNQAKPQAVR